MWSSKGGLKMIDGITVLDNVNEILNKAIAVYGIEAQENVDIEEI